jgi:hypothetical protein
MTKNDLVDITPKLKVAKSRFLLLEALSTNSRTSDINWEDVIPNEDDVLFYSSLNAQISYFSKNYLMFAQVRTLPDRRNDHALFDCKRKWTRGYGSKQSPIVTSCCYAKTTGNQWRTRGQVLAQGDE